QDQTSGSRLRRRRETAGSAYGEIALKFSRDTANRCGRCLGRGVMSCPQPYQINTITRGGEMISSLSGKLIEMAPPFILVEVQGVGYEVEVPNSTLYRLPQMGEPIFLYTHFVVREDAQLLYGFDSHAERALFRQLIKISGVGPKLGLAILS